MTGCGASWGRPFLVPAGTEERTRVVRTCPGMAGSLERGTHRVTWGGPRELRADHLRAYPGTITDVGATAQVFPARLPTRRPLMLAPRAQEDRVAIFEERALLAVRKGERILAAARQLEQRARLLRLPDWVAVFPGHFEGPCGKGMCGRPSMSARLNLSGCNACRPRNEYCSFAA